MMAYDDTSIYEDNAGGIHMVINTGNGRKVVFSGYERATQTMSIWDDIAALLADDIDLSEAEEVTEDDDFGDEIAWVNDRGIHLDVNAMGISGYLVMIKRA